MRLLVQVKLAIRIAEVTLLDFVFPPASIQLIALNRQKVGGIYKTKSKEGEQYLILIKLN